MSLNDMRLYILQSYPKATSKFREKVTKMKPNQVIAIYHSLIERAAKKKEQKVAEREYHQIDIFEYMLNQNALVGGPGTHTEIAI